MANFTPDQLSKGFVVQFLKPIFKCHYGILRFHSLLCNQGRTHQQVFLTDLHCYLLACACFIKFCITRGFKRLNGYYGIKRSAVLVGSPSQLNQLSSWLDSQENKGFVYLGAFLTDNGKLNLPGIKNLGFYTDLDSYAKNTYQIVVLPDETDGDRLMSVADLATKYGCRFIVQ